MIIAALGTYYFIAIDSRLHLLTDAKVSVEETSLQWQILQNFSSVVITHRSQVKELTYNTAIMPSQKNFEAMSFFYRREMYEKEKWKQWIETN